MMKLRSHDALARPRGIARIVCVFPLLALVHCSADDTADAHPGNSTADASPDAGLDATGDATLDTPSDLPTKDAQPDTSTGTDSSPPPDAGRCSVTGDGRTTVSFVNHCTRVVHFEGSDIQGGVLNSGEIGCRDVGSDTETLPSKRYWGFAETDPGGGRRSLAEFTFNTDFNDFDWYNLSHVDAFNLPLQIFPVDRDKCDALTCADDLLASCPPEGRYPQQGEILACVSPDRDDPTNPVAAYFEASCADAYSWSGDDADSMEACAGEDYDIVFCPKP